MNLNRLKCKDIVEVQWIDADAPGDSKWHDETELEEWSKSEYLVNDVGYVIGLTKEYLIMVAGFCEIPDYMGQYHREIKIPRGCIRKARKLK